MRRCAELRRVSRRSSGADKTHDGIRAGPSVVSLWKDELLQSGCILKTRRPKTLAGPHGARAKVCLLQHPHHEVGSRHRRLADIIMHLQRALWGVRAKRTSEEKVLVKLSRSDRDGVMFHHCASRSWRRADEARTKTLGLYPTGL